MTEEEISDSERYDSDADDDETSFENDAGKRAYHNLLERKRRDNIKDSFAQLRESIPFFKKRKKGRASRVQILKKACEFIKQQPDLQKLKDDAAILEEENRLLEKSLAEFDKAVENNDLETIARLQAMNLHLKRRHYLLELDDSDSEEVDSSDDESSSSPHDVVATSSRKKIRRS